MNVNQMWTKVFEQIQKITGDVDFENKGTLQEQIDTTYTGDSKDNTTTYISADSTTATSWTEVGALTSGEKHSSIFNKVSTMFQNVRYLYNNVGKIKGIIESLYDCAATTEDGYAASAKALGELNSNIVKYIKATEELTLRELYDKYASQNNDIYMTYFNYTDTKSINNNNTIAFMFDWIILGITTNSSKIYTYSFDNNGWVTSDN